MNRRWIVIFAAVGATLLSPAHVLADFSTQPQNPLVAGIAELNAGHYPLALNIFAKAIKAQPGNVQARYCYAIALHYLGRLPEANREYEWVAKTTTDEALQRRARKGISGCSSFVSPTGTTYSAAPDLAAAAAGQNDGNGWGGEGAGAAGAPLIGRPDTAGLIARRTSAIESSPPQAPSGGGGGARIIDVYTDW